MSRLPFGSLRSALTHHEIPLSSALELVLPKEKNQDRVTYVCELNVTYVSDRTKVLDSYDEAPIQEDLSEAGPIFSKEIFKVFVIGP